jgi:hypothetical protein
LRINDVFYVRESLGASSPSCPVLSARVQTARTRNSARTYPRSLGPSVISGQWEGWWIYWIGPMAGMLLAVLACSFLAKRIEVAKLYHFDSDRDRLFRRMAMPKSPISARNARETES